MYLFLLVLLGNIPLERLINLKFTLDLKLKSWLPHHTAKWVVVTRWVFSVYLIWVFFFFFKTRERQQTFYMKGKKKKKKVEILPKQIVWLILPKKYKLALHVADWEFWRRICWNEEMAKYCSEWYSGLTQQAGFAGKHCFQKTIISSALYLAILLRSPGNMFLTAVDTNLVMRSFNILTIVSTFTIYWINNTIITLSLARVVYMKG